MITICNRYASRLCPASVGWADSQCVPKLVGIRYFPNPLGIVLAYQFQFIEL